MTSDLLRRAAAKVREEAEGADDGFAWASEGSFVDTDPECGFDAGTSLLADHIALWHPSVALAVADWLDSVADACTSPDDAEGKYIGRTIARVDEDHAVAIARLLLGEEA